ncbi:MAG: ornithine carbamoyltransferase [Anaerolineae bacterium]|jgi:ornithine carbamoyltransferase|nr:ornithine carbamoyltransferase [Anaerolineae bacterium]
MKHFLDLTDWSSQDLRYLIRLAQQLKLEWHSGGNRPVLAGKTLGMIFQKPSLRTRVSFDVGMQHLGGHAIMLGPEEIGLGKRESIADVARVLSSMTQGIMARVFAHSHVTELAKWSRVPVINGLSDDSHPCQAMADILTIVEHFGYTDGLRLAYIGDGNNIAMSLLRACAAFGIHYRIASPEGYELPARIVAEVSASHPALHIDLLRSPADAVQAADIIYTDTWVSMGQEDEAAARVPAFQGYRVDADLVARAEKHTIVMHDLPAYRGKEITDDVADGPQSVIFAQAENRLHAQKAILVSLLS